MSSSILVTGATGFLGRHVVAKLKSRGLRAIQIDHAWESLEQLEALLGDGNVDHAIHLGWYANPSDYLIAVAPNLRSLQASLELVSLLVARQCKSIVVAGSCAEYFPSQQRLGEDSVVKPWSIYGATKASLHILLRSSLCPASTKVTWARLFNITGPGEHPSRLIPSVIESVKSGLPIALSPGLQIRDYLDVDDVADALIHLSLLEYSGTVNICSGVGTELRSLLQAIACRVGDPRLLQFGARGYNEHDSMITVGDPTRLADTGWTPAHDMISMIDRIVSA